MFKLFKRKSVSSIILAFTKVQAELNDAVTKAQADVVKLNEADRNDNEFTAKAIAALQEVQQGKIDANRMKRQGANLEIQTANKWLAALPKID